MFQGHNHPTTPGWSLPADLWTSAGLSWNQRLLRPHMLLGCHLFPNCDISTTTPISQILLIRMNKLFFLKWLDFKEKYEVNRRTIGGLQYGSIFNVKFGNHWDHRWRGFLGGHVTGNFILPIPPTALISPLLESSWCLKSLLFASKVLVYVSKMVLIPFPLGGLSSTLLSLPVASSPGKSPLYSLQRLAHKGKLWRSKE